MNTTRNVIQPCSAEGILLPLQKMQQAHDEVAHRDILSFDLYKRLKHMVLHFYKYAGRIEVARSTGDLPQLRHTLIDTFIICMASANAMNLSLGEKISEVAEANDLDALARELGKKLNSTDLFAESVRILVILGGQMAKAIESADHMERGDPRAVMESHVGQLTVAVLSILGHLNGPLEKDVQTRLEGVELKSIFLRPFPALVR
jgi:NTP pyrophosphatase (non-canonical NTP hydrolase)